METRDTFWLTHSEIEEVQSIIESGEIVQGKEVECFEREFSSYVGSKHAIACNSGTSGLHMALLAAGLIPKAEVVTTPLSFVATSNAVLFSGGVPVFADIDRRTLNISTHSTIEKLRRNTFAVLGVHLYGFPFDIEDLMNICARNNVVLIEDAAQALGASYKGKKVGTFGELGVYSFYDTKHLKLGEGGMVVTDNYEIAEKCRMIRSHGARKQYTHEILGYNYRLNEVFARIGRIQLKKINMLIEKKRERAKIIHEQLIRVKGISVIQEAPDTESVYYRFPLILNDERLRGRLIQYVNKDTGYTLATGYPTLIYEQPLYRNLLSRHPVSNLLGMKNYQGSLCPIAESLLPRIIEIPTDPWIPEERILNITDSIRTRLKNLL